MRMRTISEAAAEIRAADAQTGLTKTALRRLVTTGAIPSVKIGNKYLIQMELLESYMGGGIPAAPEQQIRGEIRRVEA